MRLTSPAFRDGAPIPRRFTCDGADVSPPLTFSASPHGTQELALVVEDVDAGRFLHWTPLALKPTAGGLRAAEIPAGAVQTENGFGKHAYGGPCPPKGADAHRYVFSLYARGTLTGTYARQGS